MAAEGRAGRINIRTPSEAMAGVYSKWRIRDWIKSLPEFEGGESQH